MMRTESVVYNVVGPLLAGMHKARQKALLDVVVALLLGRRCLLTALGRSVQRAAKPKHRIQCVHRLLGNRHLERELPKVMGRHVRRVLQKLKQPVVALDWTQFGALHVSLVASLIHKGRSVPLVYHVHKKCKCHNHRAHVALLRELKAALPEGCRPILLTDAGFQNPFVKAAYRRGFDVVRRLSKSVRIQLPGERHFTRARHLHEQACPAPRSLGVCTVTYRCPLYLNVVLYQSPHGAAAARCTLERALWGCCHIQRRTPLASTASAYRRRAGDPWLLASTLHSFSASALVKLYALRMQCEEGFRDLKSHRFGFSLSDVRCQSPERLSVLLLFALLATLVAFILGSAAEARRLQFHFQANTSKRRVLSLFTLALLLIADPLLQTLRLHHLQAALEDIQTAQLRWRFANLP